MKRIQTVSASPQQRVQAGYQRFETQTQKIATLSAELERAILELKAIATQINQDSRQLFPNYSPKICHYNEVYVPIVEQFRSNEYLVTSRPVDLFKAERDAMILANSLRRRTQKKRSIAS